VDFAARRRLPAIYGLETFANDYGLMAYGASPVDNWRRAASYVDKILRGAKPADLPIEQPTKFDLAVNLFTARALGLTIPQSVLQQATEVIQ
jgi:putative ABC transport system substrate-binding protein